MGWRPWKPIHIVNGLANQADVDLDHVWSERHQRAKAVLTGTEIIKNNGAPLLANWLKQSLDTGCL
jgi:hypothetical protein